MNTKVKNSQKIIFQTKSYKPGRCPMTISGLVFDLIDKPQV